MDVMNRPRVESNIGALRRAQLILVNVPLCAFTITVAPWVASWFQDFPIDPAEAMTPTGQKMLSRIITGKDGAVIKPYRCSGLDAEPLKQRTNLAVTVNGRPIFIKFATARNLPLKFKALVAAMLSEPREIAFFREMAENEAAQSPARLRMPMDRIVVPRLIAARSNMWRYTSLLAMELVDQEKYVVLPDSTEGLHVRLIQLVVNRAAEMHAANWQPPNTVLPEVYDRSGLSFLGLVDLCKHDASIPCNPHFGRVWDAMAAWAKQESAKPDGCMPMTVGHGDCRPGNMMFRRDIVNDPESEASQRAIREDPDAVVFCDWEAANLVPWLWDPVYCIGGLSITERNKYEKPILREYVANLSTALRRDPTKVAEADRIARMPEATIDLVVAMMKLCTNAFGLAISKVGLVGENHGNTGADMNAWGLRNADCVANAVRPCHGVADAIGVPQSDLDAINAYVQSTLTGPSSAT